MRKQKGFSLIELLIVVAIILIIAAIAIPNLLRARMASNESSAVASIRTINTAMVSYNSSYPTVGYAPLLVNLGPGGVSQACPTTPTTDSACLIDGQLASGSKSGYNFAATGTSGSYAAWANPVQLNATGVNSFCSIADAVVRNAGQSGSVTTCAGTETPIQ